MAEATEIIRKFKDGLQPFIKPRDQVNYIRRVLAIHLGTCAGHDGPIRQPLSLADTSCDVEDSPDLNGSFREYIETLRVHIAARRQLDQMLRSSPAEGSPSPKTFTAAADLLEERVCLLRWHQKLERLRAVRHSLDSLMEKPAATPDFLDVKQILQGTPSLPSAVDDFIDGLAVEKEAPESDLAEQLQQMEKVVLRARMRLKQEEQVLREVKARSGAKLEATSLGVRLEALKATRKELIGWIETELGKVPNDHVDQAHHTGSESRHPPKEGPTLSAKLDEISGKYASYVSSRRTLLDLAAQKPQPALLPAAQFSMSTTSDKPPAPAPISFLLTPYLSTLIATAAKQKAITGQKTFISAALGKESQEACQLLGHLGEESHLLPAYPMKDSLRRRSGIQHEIAMRSSEQPDISERIKPWVFAADSAKIATLESVAETVEGGQVALESSMSLLQDIDVLLGRDDDPDDEGSAGEEASEDDGWHSGRRTRKPTEKKKKKKQKQGTSSKESDVWSRLHGNLGLLGQGY